MVAIARAQMVTLESIAIVHQFAMLTMIAMAMAPQ
jgi:hypothetical protein